jgi:hypothetical protein
MESSREAWQYMFREPGMKQLETLLIYTEGVLIQPVMETWVQLAGDEGAHPEMLESVDAWNSNRLSDKRFLELAGSVERIPGGELVDRIINAMDVDEQMTAWLNSMSRRFRVLLCTDIADSLEQALRARSLLPFPEVNNKNNPLQEIERETSLIVARNPLTLYQSMDSGWNAIVYHDFDRFIREIALRGIPITISM